MNAQLETMTARELFLVKTALNLLADQMHQDLLNGDVLADNDFDAVAELEKSFVIAYQEKVGA